MANSFDVIIVGSGFGDAVTACRLAQAGRKVLERGREWTPDSYPRSPDDAWIWDDNEPEKQNGWINLRYFGDMTVVQGAAVGGAIFPKAIGLNPSRTIAALAEHIAHGMINGIQGGET
jgi:cholesterol oxidase